MSLDAENKGTFRRPSRATGLTLVELLVAIGVIAILLAVLLPALVSARAQARTLRCQSNVRKLCQALMAYAAVYEGKFPPNQDMISPGQYWFDLERAGLFFGGKFVANTDKVGGNVLVCPDDPDAQRSYAMNIWASSAVDVDVRDQIPARGTLWSYRAAQPSRMILVTEQWSSDGSELIGWYAPAAIGFAGQTPGQRFGAGGGVAPPYLAGRWGMVNCELPYMRHRIGHRTDTTPSPHGRVSIGYADGHVAMKSDDELVNPAGNSTGDSLWSPEDSVLQLGSGVR